MVRSQKSLQLIQLLRGVASILVVLLHITIRSREIMGINFLDNFFEFGGSGVDIFFVLSGFIITYSNFHYLARPSAIGKFLKRRFIRIFPIYWIIITGFLILQLALPAFYNTHFDTGIGNILKTYLLLPGHIMLNGVSWSLTNELFFYLLFTLALIIPNKKYSLYLLIAYFIFLVIFAVIVPVENANVYVGMLTFPMNIEFLLGVFIVLIVNKISNNWVYPLLIMGILLFVAGAFLSNNEIAVISNSSNPALSRVLLFGLPSFLIILSVVKLELNRTVKIHNVFLQMGDASYSIYLIHLPVVAAFFKLLVKFNINNPVLIFLLTCILFIGICVAGIFIFHKIEQPLIKKLNKILL